MSRTKAVSFRNALKLENAKVTLGRPAPDSARNGVEEQDNPKVHLGRAARASVHNTVKLEREAAAVARRLTIPAGIEFARFDHAGKTYAISVKLLVQVDLLTSRVPEVVLRARPKQGS